MYSLQCRNYEKIDMSLIDDGCLQTVFTINPDIILADITRMGDHATSYLRLLHATRHSCIYLLPSDCNIHDLEERIGASIQFLHKPYNDDDLCSLIESTLRNHPAHVSESNGEIFRLMVEEGSDLILLMDKNLKILYQSPSIKRILGYDQNETYGRNILEFIHPDDRDSFTEKFNIFLDNPDVVPIIELRVLHRDGSLRYLEVKAKNHINNPLIRGIIANCRNITERKRIELELYKYQKLESLGILAGGIAHDFNNVLTAIIGNLSLVKMEIDASSGIYETLTDAEKAAYRAKHLTEQLLIFSKGGSPVRQTASIRDIIDDTVDFILHGFTVQCDVSIPDDIMMVDIDEGQISQVINNLIINAAQSMPDGGMIKITAENIHINGPGPGFIKGGNYIKISVTDYGCGIPRENIGKIFDPFFTTKSGGSGLGLATAYSVILRHGGYIDLESTPGKGTTFFLYLPAIENTVQSVRTAGSGIIQGHGKILLMDDDTQILKTTGRLLSKLGYTVECANDGLEALEMFASSFENGTPYDVFIADLTIPGGIGGKATLEAIRQIDPDVKAIVSSGYSNNPVMAEYKKYGFSAVVKKPYKFEELHEVLLRLINP